MKEKFSSPKVTIDLAEYELLKSQRTESERALEERLHETNQALVLQTLFIKKLYDEYTATKKLTNIRKAEALARDLNGYLEFKKDRVEVKPKY
jgi:hypothetical protein